MRDNNCIPQKIMLSEKDKPIDNIMVVLYWEVSDKSNIGWRFGAKWFVVNDGKISEVCPPSHYREILR